MKINQVLSTHQISIFWYPCKVNYLTAPFKIRANFFFFWDIVDCSVYLHLIFISHFLPDFKLTVSLLKDIKY